MIMAIAGHISCKMLDYYSKPRMDAKRKALEELDAWRNRAMQEALGQEPPKPAVQ